MNFRIKIASLIVLYHPDKFKLINCISSQLNQVDKLMIIVNSNIDKNILLNFNDEKIEIIYNTNNLGIGAAQNIGIKILKDEKFDFILLSDQDSYFPENYVFDMSKKYISLSKKYKIAAICPLFVNSQNKKIYPMIKRKFFFRFKFLNQNKINFVTEAISSGMFIPTNVFKDVGTLNEILFIDWVDFEWCWRALNKNYKICVNSDLIIDHELGIENKNFITKQFPKFKFFRYYYIFRNGIYLSLFSREIPITWRINIFFTVFKYFFGFLIIEKFNIKIFIIFYKSFFDAIFKIMGKSKKIHNV